MDYEERIALEALKFTRKKLTILAQLSDAAVSMITSFYDTDVCNEKTFCELARHAFQQTNIQVEKTAICIVPSLLSE